MYFFFSSRRRHTRCALVTGVQTCALPICLDRVARQQPVAPVLMPIRHPPWLGHLPTGSVRGPAPVCELANFRQVCIVRPQYAPQHQPETYAVAKVIASSIRKGNVLDIGGSLYTEIGRAHVRTPVTNAHLVCRLLL